MPGPSILLGSSDFLQIREEASLYVDKSAFVSEVLHRGAGVQLYPRPAASARPSP